jgi:hypothetical protein
MQPVSDPQVVAFIVPEDGLTFRRLCSGRTDRAGTRRAGDQQSQDLLTAGFGSAVQPEMDGEPVQEPLTPVFGNLIQNHRRSPVVAGAGVP